MQLLSEYTKLTTINHMIISFDLENNRKNIADNPFDYFLQSTTRSPSYQKHLSHNTAGNTRDLSTSVWQKYDPQYCLQSKLVSNTKAKTGNYQ
jgi:hypothetical protein